MTCSLIEKSRLDFYFGNLDLSERDSVEKHLFECSLCVRAFLELKRHFEIDLERGVPQPSSDLKTKLLAEVKRQFPGESRNFKSSWPVSNRFPFRYYGAAAAVFVAILLLNRSNFAVRQFEPRSQASSLLVGELKTSLDSARQAPESVNFL